jgi:hypothetical protein
MYRKNTSGQFVGFQMVLTATGAIATGLSPTARRCIDGTFAAATGTITEDTGTGGYKFAMSQADTNGNDISFWFTATGAIPVCVNIVTTACDPTAASNFGITNIDGTITSRMATYTQPTGFLAATFPTGTVANTTNITAGTITTVTTVTNQLTAAQIATGVWTDTTAGDFTTALSVGKSLMNGVALGTGLTVNDITTKTGYSLASGTQTFNMTGNITGNLSGSVGSVTGAVGSVTGNVGGSVASVTARVTANADQVNGNATAAANVAHSMQAITRGTCSGGSTTTAIVSTLTSPGSLGASGQLIGRTILFDADTTTTNLQGQASNITASTTGATPTITFTAMTTAPANGDTFSIL